MQLWVFLKILIGIQFIILRSNKMEQLNLIKKNFLLYSISGPRALKSDDGIKTRDTATTRRSWAVTIHGCGAATTISRSPRQRRSRKLGRLQRPLECVYLRLQILQMVQRPACARREAGKEESARGRRVLGSNWLLGSRMGGSLTPKCCAWTATPSI